MSLPEPSSENSVTNSFTLSHRSAVERWQRAIQCFEYSNLELHAATSDRLSLRALTANAAISQPRSYDISYSTEVDEGRARSVHVQ